MGRRGWSEELSQISGQAKDLVEPCCALTWAVTVTCGHVKRSFPRDGALCLQQSLTADTINVLGCRSALHTFSLT